MSFQLELWCFDAFPGQSVSCHADAVTKAWLQANMDPVVGCPSLVRFSWQTTDTLLQNSAVPVDWYEQSVH